MRVLSAVVEICVSYIVAHGWNETAMRTKFRGCLQPQVSRRLVPKVSQAGPRREADEALSVGRIRRSLGRICRVVASTPDEAKSSRGTVLHASPDLADDDAVVLIAFAVADAGPKNLSVQPRERQILSDLARLRQHEFHILERLARASFSREVAAHHLGALSVHDLRIGRRLARDLKEAC